MSNAIKTGRRANLIGSGWMILAMAGFAIEDAMIKAAALTLPIGQILILFGLGGMAVFATLAFGKGEPLFSADVLSRPMRIRAVFEVSARLFYVMALALTPLSSATVILQATPIVVVAGAAIVFYERVGWRRWLAIFIGLGGVLIILRPGSDSFSVLSILAVLGMLGFAGRDLSSRAAPASLRTSVLGFYGFLAILVAGLLFSLWSRAPFQHLAVNHVIYLSGAVLAGCFAYSSLMKAMRSGDVSFVTPFRYTRLLFGIGLGIAMFGESLDRATIIGSGLIVLSGLFIMWRGKNS